jgi:hypothetical protein
MIYFELQEGMHPMRAKPDSREFGVTKSLVLQLLGHSSLQKRPKSVGRREEAAMI